MTKYLSMTLGLRLDHLFDHTIWAQQYFYNAPMSRTLPLPKLSLYFFILVWIAWPCTAQELEPRRWTHLPVNVNFAAGAYAYKKADIALDPVLRIENADMELHSWAIEYIRTFEILEKPARIDLLQAWQVGYWSGTVNGVPTSIDREGWSDTVVRFAVNLLGAPPLSQSEYKAYRATLSTETIVGAALAVQLPTGQYKENKLINLGSNRFSFRPQIGVVHNHGQWSFETTGAVWIYTDNNSFFNGNRLEQDPFYTLQAHVVYNFRPGLWVAVSTGYGIGGETMVNGVKNNDLKKNAVWGISAGYPITNWLGVKAGYVSEYRQTTIGSKSDTFAISISTSW